MAIVYVDLVNGNDANNGSTWALAKKTIPLNASNEVRIAKSPDPVSSGVNATFIKYTNTIVLASPLSKTIDQAVDNTWVSSANVTGGTYNTYRKLGTTCQQFTIAAAFTTGKVAYKTIPLSDFSAYSKISFWLSVSSIAIAQNSNLRLCLCSDTLGNVIVNSIPITVINTQPNYLCAIVQDYGAALGNNIQSVALYCDVDAGSVVLRLNNIEAVNNVHHQSLVGISAANGSRWYGVESIVGNIITIAQGYTISAGTNMRGYDENDGTYLLYYRLPILYTTQNSISANGISVQLLFGWNKVSNEVDGETWLDYICQYNIYAFSLSGNGQHSIKNVGIYRTGKALVNSTASSSINIENVSIVCAIPLNGQILSGYGLTIDGLRVLNCTGYQNNNGIEIKSGSQSIKNVEALNIIMGSTEFYGVLEIETLAAKFENIRVSNSLTGMLINGHANYFKNTIIQKIYTSDLVINGGETVFDNFQFVDRGTGALYLGGNTLIKNSPDLTQYNFGTGYGHNIYKLREVNNALGINKIWIDAKCSAWWQTAVKREGEDGAWRFDNTSYNYSGNSDIRPSVTLAEIAVEQGIEITISVWVCANAGAINNELAVRPEMCDVVSEKVSTTIQVTGTDIWQQASITIMPNRTGILVLELVYKIGNLYIGSISL